MKFGTFNFHALPPHTNSWDVVRNGLEQAVAAEDAGFSEVWLPEHNGRDYGLLGNTVVAAAAIAARTKRIRIATAVSRLPLHNAVHMAEDLAYVDIISNGRMDWGVGKGYDPVEFGSYGISLDEKEERWQETFDAVLHIWRTKRTAFKGRFFEFQDAKLLPEPLQRPTLPVYVMVSKSDESVVWAAKQLLPVAIGSGPKAPDVKHKLELYGEVAAAEGYEDRAIRETVARCWQLKQVHVAATTERAIDEFRDGLMWYFDALANRAQFGFSSETEEYDYYIRHESVLIGSTEKVLNSLGKYHEECGMNNVICWMNIGGQPHLQVLNAIHQFGEEIIPELRSVTG
jgi:alkanesulfonate monooxygenase SsuD/methylene tetrahydromethanopterin reductase-like flavin-dependent oxidoreductase (luciferase family)